MSDDPPCCFPWRLRGIGDSGELTGPNAIKPGECAFCKREIAIPKPHHGKPCACIYCGIDRGWITEDVPINPEEAASLRSPATL